jgi:acyl-CoA dehydrogenase-like protein
MPASVPIHPRFLLTSHKPLSVVAEDEKMFQSTVRRFARAEIVPHVRETDEAGVFRKDIIQQFFALGLMGIEIPGEYGGQGGTFFQCVLAVEELSAVDPSAGASQCPDHESFSRSERRMSGMEPGLGPACTIATVAFAEKVRWLRWTGSNL